MKAVRGLAAALLPAEFARFVREEIDTYQTVITAAGIKPQ